MSYENMVREEMQCDFPDCSADFDTTAGALVAIVRGEALFAFCAAHCVRLTQEGIELRSLAEIRHEIREAEEAPERARRERERVKREQEFIEKFRK